MAKKNPIKKMEDIARRAYMTGKIDQYRFFNILNALNPKWRGEKK